MREREDAHLSWTAALSAEALDRKSDGWLQAEGYYRKAVELDAENAHYRRRLGTHLAAKGKLTEAESIFSLLAEEDPRDHQTWFHRGRIASDQGDRERAVGFFAKALALQPANSRYEKALRAVQQ